MNKERMLQLAKFLEDEAALNEHLGNTFIFDMGDPSKEIENECGTVGCIAGAAVSLWSPENVHHYHIMLIAQELLELTYDQRRALFDPVAIDFNFPFYEDAADTLYTRRNAARAVKLMAEGDEKPWEKIFKDMAGDE
jgi:hypothetical protein